MSREHQIVEAIRRLYDEGSTEVTIHQIRDSHARNPQLGPSLPYRWKALIGAVLRTLESTGIVKASGAGRYKLLNPIGRVEVVQFAPSNAVPDDESQQRSPGNRPPDEPPRAVDGGGAGYREVLSHPSLFSSAADDFDRLLARIGGRS